MATERAPATAPKQRAGRTAARARSSGSVPPDVVRFVRGIFVGVIRTVTNQLSAIPTRHEPQLDMTFVAALAAMPAVDKVAGWGSGSKPIFLGGRHLFLNWEMADIGLLIIYRVGARVRRIKVALLQSKRLYPNEIKTLDDPEERMRSDRS